MNKHGYSFVVMAKGMNDLVGNFEHLKKTFENKWRAASMILTYAKLIYHVPAVLAEV